MSRKFFKLFPDAKVCTKWQRRIVQHLLTIYPQWDSYVVVDTYKGEYSLSIKVPAPYHPTERDLMISTFGDRLTVHVDLYHAHFDTNERMTDQEILTEASDFVAQILAEQVVVCVRTETLGAAMWLSPDMLATHWPNDWVGYTRSWRGTYNKNY
jgi:hypothetical protein